MEVEVTQFGRLRSLCPHFQALCQSLATPHPPSRLPSLQRVETPSPPPPAVSIFMGVPGAFVRRLPR